MELTAYPFLAAGFTGPIVGSVRRTHASPNVAHLPIVHDGLVDREPLARVPDPPPPRANRTAARFFRSASNILLGVSGLRTPVARQILLAETHFPLSSDFQPAIKSGETALARASQRRPRK
jgi:hypothetical protein